MLNRRQLSALLACTAIVPTQAFSQAYPNKTIRLVCPFPAGGSGDALARKLAAALSISLGQPVFVDNKPGGNNIPATQINAAAAPDGYTIFITITTPYTVNPAIFRKLPYDGEKDYTPVATLSEIEMGIAVSADSPFRTLRELVDYAKQNPGKLTYGSSGVGQLNSMAMEILKSDFGMDVVHIPYQGSAPVMQAMMAKQVDVFFADLASVLPFVKAKSLKILAVDGRKRSAQLPEVPTIIESGFQDPKIPAMWFGVVGPPHLPPAITAKLNAGINQALAAPAVREHLEITAQRVVVAPPEELRDRINSDRAVWGGVIRRLNIKID